MTFVSKMPLKHVHDRRGALSGQKVIGIILFVVGVMLLLFIISQAVKIVKDSRDSSDSKGGSSVHCVGYLYTIKGITVTDEELQFDFVNEPSSSEDVHNLTVIDSSRRKQSFQVSIPVGSSLSVRVPVMVDGNFSVYPDNCAVFPARCSIEGLCSYR